MTQQNVLSATGKVQGRAAVLTVVVVFAAKEGCCCSQHLVAAEIQMLWCQDDWVCGMCMALSDCSHWPKQHICCNKLRP